jgi:hypothetical protein
MRYTKDLATYYRAACFVSTQQRQSSSLTGTLSSHSHTPTPGVVHKSRKVRTTYIPHKQIWDQIDYHSSEDCKYMRMFEGGGRGGTEGRKRKTIPEQKKKNRHIRKPKPSTQLPGCRDFALLDMKPFLLFPRWGKQLLGSLLEGFPALVLPV